MVDIAPANSTEENAKSANRLTQVETIPVGKIKGEHPCVSSVRSDTIGSLRDLPKDAFTAEGLAEIAQHTMLHVVPKGDRYYCIAPLRLYRLLKSALSPADELSVIVHHRISRKKLERFVLLDFLIIPVFYSLDPKDRTRMNTAWENPNSAGFINHVVQPVVSPRGKMLSPLARMLNCDARTSVFCKPWDWSQTADLITPGRYRKVNAECSDGAGMPLLLPSRSL
ncbi:MAG: hypothetical protein M1568_04410 [Acidobacteria bacterium]|nr:hypothetical protein [Acidobacteriota bacterium]